MDAFLDFLVHTKGWLRADQAAAIPTHLTGAALDRHLVDHGLMRLGHVRRARLDMEAQLTVDLGPGAEGASAEAMTVSPSRVPPRPSTPPPAGETRKQTAPPGQVIANVAVERVCSRRARSVTYFGRLAESKKPVLLRDGALVDADETLLAAWLTTPLPEACGPTDRVANYYDKGRSDSGLWITREFVDGRPLSEVITGEAIEPEAVERMAVDVLVGLAALHQLGSIHGRLHAGNVILSARSGRPRLVDHSLVEFVRLVEGNGGAGAVVAPEVLAGADPTSRSDMWRFGVLLCEMLAGMVVPERATVSGRTDVATVIAEGLRKLEDGPFRSLVASCVDDDPTKRPFNGRAALQRVRVAGVRAARSSEGNSGAPPADEVAEEQASPAPERPRRRWWIAAVAGLILTGVGIASPNLTGYLSSVFARAEVQPPPPPPPKVCDAKLADDQLVALLAVDQLPKFEPCRPGCENCRNREVQLNRVGCVRNWRQKLKEADTADKVLAVLDSVSEQKDMPWIGGPIAVADLQESAVTQLRERQVAAYLGKLPDGELRLPDGELRAKLQGVLAEDVILQGPVLRDFASEVAAVRGGKRVAGIVKDGPLRKLLSKSEANALDKLQKLDEQCDGERERLTSLIPGLTDVTAVENAMNELRGKGDPAKPRRAFDELRECCAKVREAIANFLRNEVETIDAAWKTPQSPLSKDARAPSGDLPTLRRLLADSVLADAGVKDLRSRVEGMQKRAEEWKGVQAAAAAHREVRKRLIDLVCPYVAEKPGDIDVEARRKARSEQVPALDSLCIGLVGEHFQKEAQVLRDGQRGFEQACRLVRALRCLGDFGQLQSTERKALEECLKRADQEEPTRPDSWSRAVADLKLKIVDGPNGLVAFGTVIDVTRRHPSKPENLGPQMKLVLDRGRAFYVDWNAQSWDVEASSLLAAPEGPAPEKGALASEWIHRVLVKESLGRAKGPEVFRPEETSADLLSAGLLLVATESPLTRGVEPEALRPGDYWYRRFREVSAGP